jgi:YD repeat-containing protein
VIAAFLLALALAFAPNHRVLAASSSPQAAVTTHPYDELGRPTSRTLPDGAVERFQYDQDGQLLVHTGFAGHFNRALGAVPSTEEGLAAWVSQPSTAAKWNGPYLSKAVPLDHWGRAYLYPGCRGRVSVCHDARYARETSSKVIALCEVSPAALRKMKPNA